MPIYERLETLGISLPAAPSPAGNYRPVVIREGLGFVSGQFPFRNGALLYTGRVGAELTVAQAKEATAVAALNVLAQIHGALNGWERFGGLLRLDGFVASAKGFANQPEILDAASDLFVDVLADRGEHARTAFSVEQLPLNSPIELVVTFTAR